ncbi:MAG: hypothetical protein JO099_07320 [Acidobacteriia bacterium]|nr:hypothetical protein [Terriglobia bacterium]
MSKATRRRWADNSDSIDVGPGGTRNGSGEHAVEQETERRKDDWGWKPAFDIGVPALFRACCSESGTAIGNRTGRMGFHTVLRRSYGIASLA